jgi:hypothetical protein
MVLVASACASIVGIDHDYRIGDTTVDGGGPDGKTDADADAGVDAQATDAPDDSPPIDAGEDGACSGHVCQGKCFAGSTCASCASAQLFCATTHVCVSACATCGAGPTIACYSCSSDGGAVGTGSAEGSCEPAATAYCLGSGYTHCKCDGGASLCPGSEQVCLSAIGCESCGASGTDGRQCKNGMSCSQAGQNCN